MKKIIYKLIIGGAFLVGVCSCEKDFIDLTPPAAFTDVVYFKQPSDFKAYATGFYSQLMGWASPYGGNSVFDYVDGASDLCANTYGGSNSYALGHGSITVPTSDNRWDKNYNSIRSVNTLLAKAQVYSGAGDISQYVGEAYFFRANAYFNLLKFYGGVPIVTKVLDVNSPELQAPRNSRYEVVDLILSDLNEAISRLPKEQLIGVADKGRISVWAAKAFKAKIELYEATWRRYNGTTTDYTGSKGPDTDQIAIFLSDAATLAKDIMDNGGYKLFNKNTTAPANLSSYYLFNLEDAASNPYGSTKADNNEFILYSVYDYTLRQGGQNVSHSAVLWQPSRQLLDMFLCKDGLPASVSPLFQGYHHVGDEFKNRDLRMGAFINASTDVPANGSVKLTVGLAGYNNMKFTTNGYPRTYGDPTVAYRSDNTESYNFPLIRLAEVYLIYAEALYELNGSITDDQLDASINNLRDRAGVAHLTNAFASAKGLDMKGEIRRERTIELYQEGNHFDDLKRWGTLEATLNPSRCGRVVGDATYTTEFKDATGANTALYTPSRYAWGEETVETAAGSLKCVVIDSYKNHTVTKKHYLWPIPQNQISINKNLKQNPEY